MLVFHWCVFFYQERPSTSSLNLIQAATTQRVCEQVSIAVRYSSDENDTSDDCSDPFDLQGNPTKLADEIPNKIYMCVSVLWWRTRVEGSNFSEFLCSSVFFFQNLTCLHCGCETWCVGKLTGSSVKILQCVWWRYRLRARLSTLRFGFNPIRRRIFFIRCYCQVVHKLATATNTAF